MPKDYRSISGVWSDSYWGLTLCETFHIILVVVPGPISTRMTLTASFPRRPFVSASLMSRQVVYFLITLFLNLGAGNELLLLARQSTPTGSTPEARGTWVAEQIDARDTGKDWGMPCLSVDHAPKMLEMGARFIPFGCDLIFVKQGLEKIQADFGKLGFTFDRKI